MAHLRLCRYTGSKAKLRSQLLSFMRPLAEGVDMFVDVFAGTGSIVLEMMYQRPDLLYVVNDADPTVTALWLAVRDQPQWLVQRVESFTPSLDQFDEFRSHLRLATKLPLPDRTDDVLELGFRKLAYHTMAHRGWVDGGPRGGRSQFEHWVRQKLWPDRIPSIIRLSSDRMRLPREVHITHQDFTPVIGNAHQQEFLFCDPPYVLDHPDWPQRYCRHRFSDADHARLAEMLRLAPNPWLLTYGNHCRVRELYQWAYIEKLTESELVITQSR